MNINGSEFLIIAILALILVGPERLPEYARTLRSVVLRLRALVRDGQSALKEELGEDIDWNQLDPRNYDPRRIVREALFDDEDATPPTGTAAVAVAATTPTGAASTSSRRARRASRPQGESRAGEPRGDGLTPYDDEAT